MPWPNKLLPNSYKFDLEVDSEALALRVTSVVKLYADALAYSTNTIIRVLVLQPHHPSLPAHPL